MIKEQNQARKLVFKSLDKFVSTCKGIIKEWETNEVPINLINVLINKMKMKEKGSPPIRQFAINYNKMVIRIYKSCQARAIETKSTKVLVSHIEELINIVKENFDKGLEG